MMNWRRSPGCRGIAVLVALLGVNWSGAAAARPNHGNPVLLISVDGMRPNDIFEAEQRGLKLPTLRSMIAEGTYARSVKNVTPTITMPNHTTLITGVVPSVHGVYDNLVFDPLRRRLNRYYWYAQDINVPTLWDVAKANGNIVASLNWPGSAGSDSISFNVPLYWRDLDIEDIKQIKALSTAGIVAELEKSSGKSLAQSIMLTPEADQVIGLYAAHILSTRRPKLFTVHLSAYDHVAHLSGPDSSEARFALENTDAVIGSIIAAGRKAIPNLVVAVVSDHGMVPLRHDVNLLRAFVDAGLSSASPKTGEFVDWEAMPWGYASAAVFLARPHDPELQARTSQFLAGLARNPEYHITEVVDLTSTPEYRAGKTPGYYVNFEAGYEMGQSLEAPLISPSRFKGMHGYLNSMKEMNSAFFMVGPSVPRAKNLGEIDMLDIAPTLAEILGTRLPTANGNSLVPLRSDRQRP